MAMPSAPSVTAGVSSQPIKKKTLLEFLRSLFVVKKAPKPEKPKIFCSNCRYLGKRKDVEGIKGDVWHLAHGSSDDLCRCEYLVGARFDEDDAVRKGTGKVTQIWYKSCRELNGKNDCKFFKSKDADEKSIIVDNSAIGKAIRGDSKKN